MALTSFSRGAAGNRTRFGVLVAESNRHWAAKWHRLWFTGIDLCGHWVCPKCAQPVPRL